MLLKSLKKKKNPMITPQLLLYSTLSWISWAHLRRINMYENNGTWIGSQISSSRLLHGSLKKTKNRRPAGPSGAAAGHSDPSHRWEPLHNNAGDRCDFEGTWIETEKQPLSCWRTLFFLLILVFCLFVPTVGPVTSHADKPWRKL